MDNAKSGKHWTLDEDSCAASRKGTIHKRRFLGTSTRTQTHPLFNFSFIGVESSDFERAYLLCERRPSIHLLPCLAMLILYSCCHV